MGETQQEMEKWGHSSRLLAQASRALHRAPWLGTGQQRQIHGHHTRGGPAAGSSQRRAEKLGAHCSQKWTFNGKTGWKPKDAGHHVQKPRTGSQGRQTPTRLTRKLQAGMSRCISGHQGRRAVCTGHMHGTCARGNHTHAQYTRHTLHIWHCIAHACTLHIPHTSHRCTCYTCYTPQTWHRHHTCMHITHMTHHIHITHTCVLHMPHTAHMAHICITHTTQPPHTVHTAHVTHIAHMSYTAHTAHTSHIVYTCYTACTVHRFHIYTVTHCTHTHTHHSWHKHSTHAICCTCTNVNSQ